MQLLQPLFSALLILYFPFEATAQIETNEQTGFNEGKSEVEQFVSAKRLAHAASKAWDAAYEQAERFPTMPEAFEEPLFLNVSSFERAVRQATDDDLSHTALVEDVRSAARGRRVETKDWAGKGVYITLSSRDGISRTESGFKTKFVLTYHNGANKQGSTHKRSTTLVWVRYENQDGKWRFAGTELGFATTR